MAKTTSESSRQFHGERTAPRVACIMAIPAEAVRFAAGEGDKGSFEIAAYDGGIAKHWYWGNFALDLSGLTFAGKPLPVLDSHETGRRIGVTTRQQIKEGVTFEGRFLGNPSAQEIRADMQDGFPMQASLYPVPSVIEQVEDGASVEVNGRKLKGPGAVFRKAVIKEVSMCVFGALNNTRSTALAADDSDQVEFELMERNNPMANQDKPALTLETFKADNPALHQSVFAAGQVEGIKTEQTRFAALQKACGDDHAQAAECFTAGMTVAEALGKRNEKLAADLKTAREQLAAQPASKIDAATAEFKSQPAPSDPKAVKFDEATATDEELKAHFAATPDLRDRFFCVADYLWYVRHPAKS